MTKQRQLYLDYAAATPLDNQVLEAMLPYLKTKYFNPSAGYLNAKKIKDDLETARSKVAGVLGAKHQEIIFTAGATEANNLAIKGIMQQYPEANVVVSAVEHESVLIPTKNFNSKIAKVDKYGRIDLSDLQKKIDDKTVLVSIMHANNEVGTVQPLSQVASIIKEKLAKRKNNLPLLLHSDCAQSANYLDLHVSRLKIDLMSLNGSKTYGPKQSGALYIKSGTKIQPQIEGGGQEFNYRSGTENVAGAVGFAEALSLASSLKEEESIRLNTLRSDLLNKLSNELPNCIINGSPKFHLPNNAHVTFPNIDNERLLMELDELGIMAAAGSACTESREEPSHVLKAMGISDKDARSSIRFTLGRQTTKKDIEYLLDSLQKIL
ncbi:MAG TPA: cysteine desulfurase family protein [Candidatus Sulfotelmatobacter sp.]|nr:cysteine desulfurase family protein [Candidatus Sulfotelmatobacter sp.]